MINGNMIGGTAPIKTIKFVDENNLEFIGVVVDQETIFTANAAEDIRDGKIAATDEGVVTGSAVIPNYFTYTGTKLITNGSEFVLRLQDGGYDYTKLQALICIYNTNINNSIQTEHVVIENKVLPVRSTEPLATVVKDDKNATINFGFTNTTGNMCLVRYFMYRELY